MIKLNSKVKLKNYRGYEKEIGKVIATVIMNGVKHYRIQFKTHALITAESNLEVIS